MTDCDNYEEFLSLFTLDRERIYAYIFSLLPHEADAEDVFQSCSLILWRKFHQFRRGEKFLSWACGVARFEVLNHGRVSSRNRLQFNDELIQQLAAARSADLSEADDRLSALRECVKVLTQDQRKLVDAAYSRNHSIKRQAELSGVASQTLYNRLGRIRRQLFDCVQNKLAAEGKS